MEILILGVGILIGISLVGVLRLLELHTGITTDSLVHLPTKLSTPRGEIILPDTTPDDIADQIIKTQNDL